MKNLGEKRKRNKGGCDLDKYLTVLENLVQELKKDLCSEHLANPANEKIASKAKPIIEKKRLQIEALEYMLKQTKK